MDTINTSNTSNTSQLNELIGKYSPFVNEIRKRILFTLVFFAAATILGFVFYEKIIKFLIGFLSLSGVNIVFTSPFQFVNLAISCGIATGLVLVFPLILYQILSFLKPALKDEEFKMLVRFLPFSLILFVVGFLFGVYVMKWQIQLFLAKSVSLGIGNILDISQLIGIVILVAIVMGIAFQLPLVLLLFMRIGIISHNYLSRQRSWVYLGSLIFAILLPIDSILADFLLVLPLVILFELTLLTDQLLKRGK